MAQPFRIKSISEAHRLGGFPKPLHPLISIIDVGQIKDTPDAIAATFDFYTVSMKRGCDKLIYGQQRYDFDEGLMAFMAPGQVLRGEEGGVPNNLEGWMMFIHPDFLWNTPLAKKIGKYDYFHYSTNEALFLSDREETTVNGIIENIRQEYSSNLDKHSQDVIVAQLELLFTYAQRFYERQFMTRKISSSCILEGFEDALSTYMEDEQLLSKGLPSPQYFAEQLHISIKYLSSVLKQLSGLSAQQHIHERLIAKAKEKLSTTELSVSEIAYELGFGHSQSFSKLFKSKTAQTPLEFRQAFQ